MIFFIDEDASAFGAWILELELRDHVVEIIKNADAAFDRLCCIGKADVSLVVIDVMLAVADPTQTRFGGERTDDNLETGLYLLKDLCDQNEVVFPRQAILLTNTANPTTKREAVRMSKDLHVPLWEKSSVYSPVNFGDRIEQRLGDLAKP
jgi:hypothetical protein